MRRTELKMTMVEVMIRMTEARVRYGWLFAALSTTSTAPTPLYASA